MLADKMRQSYVNDSLLMFDSVQKMFPEAASPADITPEWPMSTSGDDPKRPAAYRPGRSAATYRR